MHPCFGANDLERITHLYANRFYKYPSPIHIEHSHSTNVAGEVPLTNKIRQDCLIQGC